MAKRNKYDVDESLEKGFDFSKLKRSIVYVKPYAKLMLLALGLSMLGSLLGLATPILLQQAMDVAIPNGDVSMVVWLAVASLGLVLVSTVFGAIRGIIMSHCGQSIVYDIRKDIFDHLQQLPFSYYDSRPHGKILVRVVNYVNSVSDSLTNGLVNAILELLNLFFIAGYMFSINVKLSLIILSGMPFLLVFILLLKNVQKKANFENNNKNSNLTAYTCEAIEGVKVSQIFRRQKENQKIYGRLNREYQKAWYKAAYLNNMMGPVTENLKQWVLCLVYIAGILWISPSVEIGVLIAMATYASKFWQPVISLANIYNNLIKTMSYLERIFQTIDEPVDICDSPEAKPLPDMQGRVEFQNVRFAYEKDYYVLKGVNLKVEKGQRIALVGPTGSGKSTIVNLISRFYNVTEGKLLIDGVDINDITLHSLRSQMGIMLQDSFIFTGTIADNIRYGKLDATDEEIRAAAKAVCADEFISQMEQGYDTPVTERGGQLSQGERQLIAFARTMVSDPAILILDEATSSIDAKTEKLLQQGIEKLMENRTSFVIAHRLSTIRNCDKILYIDGGEIKESGTHDELMAKKGYYYRLSTAQD
ncbi:MAG: ABC transporter ATP-binding protein [Clostridia bacterium]|nr:ABC transporter ATP-binding protein [Clostridia bacterium]